MQGGMARRNKDIPADNRIEFRLGINLGDVIVGKHDVFGDGVNIAPRLTEIAPPAVSAWPRTRTGSSGASSILPSSTPAGRASRTSGRRAPKL
jgi:adenylate cyclase